MSKRHFKLFYSILLAFLIALSSFGKLSADAPIYRFAKTNPSIVKAVSKSIGFLSYYGWLKTIKIYENPSKINSSRDITISSRTVYPFGAFGYGFEPLEENILDFPVLAINGEYAHIIYDVRTFKKGWVRLDSKMRLFIFGALNVMIDRFLVILPHTNLQYITIYGHPDGDPNKDIRVKQYEITEQSKFVVLASRWNFIKIASFDDAYERYDIMKPIHKIKPLGWIRIRDKKGQLLIWLALEDNC